MTRPKTVKSLVDPRFDDLGAPVEVRRHPKARRLTLRVSRTRRAVVVTLPEKCDLNEANSFVHRNIDWVRERLESLPDPVPFRDGNLVPVRGQMCEIRHAGAHVGNGPVFLDLAAKPIPRLMVYGDKEHLSRRLNDWLLKEGHKDLEDRVAVHAEFLGLNAKRIVVRDQTTRWGSCSTTGSLSFSWRLIMAPAFVLDYVVAHEVAHLKEMNHGPDFWALVKHTMPEMEKAKTWLQHSGMDLHSFGIEESK